MRGSNTSAIVSLWAGGNSTAEERGKEREQLVFNSPIWITWMRVKLVQLGIPGKDTA